MIISKPIVIEDGYYSQRQAADALHVDRHTIARYAKAGLIRFRVRKAGNSKVTKGSEIIKCWQSMFL